MGLVLVWTGLFCWGQNLKPPDRGAQTPTARLEEKMKKHQSPHSSISKSSGNDVSGALLKNLKSHECTDSIEFPSSRPDLTVSHDNYIPDLLAETAVDEVLWALGKFMYRLLKRMEEICEEHLPAEAKAEWSSLFGLHSDAVNRCQNMAAKIAATVGRGDSPTLTTMEDMLTQVLKNAGFCCAGAVDDYVAEECESLNAFSERQLADFDPAWLTLEGSIL